MSYLYGLTDVEASLHWKGNRYELAYKIEPLGSGQQALTYTHRVKDIQAAYIEHLIPVRYWKVLLGFISTSLT